MMDKRDKTSVRLMAGVATVLVGVAGLTGCSGGEEPARTAPPAPERATPTPTPTPTLSAEEIEAQSTAALEEWVETERATLPDKLVIFNGLFSDLKVDAVPPNLVEFGYLYREGVDVDEALETLNSSDQSTDDDPLLEALAEAGVVDPQYRLTYYAPDGEEVWTHLYE